MRCVIDRSFPIDDGAFYYVKAAWMAADPLTRAMPWSAFELLAHRPPGAMWLSLPFLLVRLSFLSFAVAMLTWIIVATEIAVRGLFPRGRKPSRNVFAVTFICGNVAFFAGSETFYVDHIHTAFTVAAAGLAVGWLREKRLSQAIACGLAAAMTLWIKPAGLALIGSLCGALGVVLLLEAFLDGRLGWRGLLRNRLPHLVALVVFPTLAVLSLFFSSYKVVWEKYRPDRQQHWKQEYLEPWYAVDDGAASLHAVGQVFRNVMEVVGPPLLLVLLLGVAVVLVRSLPPRAPKEKEGRAFLLSTLFLSIVTLGVFLFSLSLSVKVNRYIAPFAGLLVATGSYVMFAPTRFRRAMLWGALLSAVVWRSLYVADVIPYRAWVRSPRTFAYPMGEARDNLEILASTCRKIDESRTFSLLALNPSVEYAGIYLVRLARWADVEGAVRELGFDPQIMTYSPSCPDFRFTDLPKFFSVDFLLAHASDPMVVFPKGSRRGDLMAMEAALYDPREAREAGWEMFHETGQARFYISAATSGNASQAETMNRRARFLDGMDFESPDGRAFARSFVTFARLRSVAPVGREVVVSDLAEQARGLLVHAPYQGNPLPEALELDIQPGDRLLLQMRPGDGGDGVTVEMDCREGAAWSGVQSWELPLGAKREIDPWQWIARKQGVPIRLRFLPGAAGDTRNDCLSVGVLSQAPSGPAAAPDQQPVGTPATQ